MIVICKLDIIFYLFFFPVNFDHILLYFIYLYCNMLFFYCKAHLKTAKLNLRGTNKCLYINIYIYILYVPFPPHPHPFLASRLIT